ncbi:MAG: hypothetical protein J6Z34_02125, partial [Clostridia bacterium]|nr:hypothetical protein [Clostridia bacterium]
MMVNGKVEYNCSGLKRLIDGYEAVSFDIFDTLVMRKVYFNHDVFLLVAEKYAEKVPDYFNVRIKAEHELSETRYPYIEEIYDYVARECNVSNELKTEIMNAELDLERSVIIARETVVDIFNYCKTIGK